MTLTVEEAGARFGVDWFRYQVDCFTHWQGEAPGQDGTPLDKMCVYYPTGKGKTKTTLTCLALRGAKEVVVIAPPVTHQQWRREGELLGIEVRPMSHAMFRMKDTKLSRNVPIIVDEFHLLGGQGGKGWQKFDRIAAGMKAPVLFCSATPNYNDAERVYCIAHVLDPWTNRGGYIAWLYQHCITEPNPFGRTPIVTGFLKYPDAAAFLADLPGVVYLPDDAPDILVDLPMGRALPEWFTRYGLDESRNRLMASQMEIRHRSRFLQIVNPATDRLHEDVSEMLGQCIGNATTPSLVFAARSQIAMTLKRELEENNVAFGYVDGKSSQSHKELELDRFKAGDYDVLIGTATLATGADGIDTMCDELVILDDTDDASLRRQLVGRILPRGVNARYKGKFAHRFVYNS